MITFEFFFACCWMMDSFAVYFFPGSCFHIFRSFIMPLGSGRSISLRTLSRMNHIFRAYCLMSLCRVCCCSSTSKKFPDIDALISHTYDTYKVGLRTKHLGLHKALCVLMGWNWRVPPDTSKAYHSIPADEANALKEDLILWPPLVIIHNSSIGNRATASEAKIMTIEEIKGVLKDIGVAAGKSRVSHGRPANQSVFLVKFLPTFSGLQEARKIHEHFAGRNHGKEEFQQIKGVGKVKNNGHVDELLYGHIAVAEDLVYLDEETKKRCLVKSKKDIEAVADAPLKLHS